MKPKQRQRARVKMRGWAAAIAAVTIVSAGASRADSASDWATVAKWPDFEGGLWIADNADGHPLPDELPLNALAKARLDVFRKKFAAGVEGGTCAPRSMPLHLGNQFIYSKGLIIIEGAPDYYNVRRHVYMDGKQHDDVDLGYFGKSLGHWEGDTLVIETSGFVPDAYLTYGLAGDGKTSIEERYRLLAPGKLQLKLTVSNPELMTRAYHTTRVYTLDPGQDTPEAYCTNNRNPPGGTADLEPPR